jgi:hypothetical protein
MIDQQPGHALRMKRSEFGAGQRLCHEPSAGARRTRVPTRLFTRTVAAEF